LYFACGIDSLNYLGSESRPYYVSQSEIGLSFLGPANPAVPPYLGINLYYRIYASETEADTDRSRLEQRQSSDYVPGSSVPNFLETTLRYVKPARNEILAPPTIPRTLESDPMSVDLIDGNLFLNIGTTSTYDLKRNVAGSLYDFSVKPIDQDSDFSNANSTDLSPYFYVQFFAASYGVDLGGSTTELFSNAVFLGRVVLTATD
jgi:hypothetical protein